MTDGGGAVLGRGAYDAYGRGLPPPGSPFGFTGHRYDPETGLYASPTRHYSPALGRWLQLDPIGTRDGLNRYAYVKNEPINGFDPLGLYDCVKATGTNICTPQFKVIGSMSGTPDGILTPDKQKAVQRAFPVDGMSTALTEVTAVGITGGAGAAAGGVGLVTARAIGASSAKRLIQNPMFKNALQKFVNSDLTKVGRAITKHPEVVGHSKGTLRLAFRSDAEINRAGTAALKNIMRNGDVANFAHPRYGDVT